MNYEIKGELVKIFETEQFASGFEKRRIVVKTIDNYPQEIIIEFMKDKVDLPDAHKVGDLVNVSFNINGKSWASPQGEIKYFNSITGWKIVSTESEPIKAKPSKKPKTIDENVFADDEDDDLPF